jgi:branched-chain amino acid transport system substrate-binding protein
MDGGSDGGDGGTKTDSGPMDLGSVTVGILNPTTGAYSSLGPGQRNGAKVAVKQINESDDYPLTIDPVYEDTGTEPSTATQAAQRALQEEGAQFLHGAISSSVALALNDLAESAETIYWASGAAVPITGEQCNEYVFRCETNTAQAAEAQSAYTVNNLGTDVWFHIADYAYGHSVYKRSKERMKAANSDFNEVGFTKSKLGSSNYGSFISQIANSEADVAVLGMTGGDLINFTKQAANQGLKDDVTLVSTTFTFQLVRAAAGDATVGTYGCLRYLPKLETGDNKQFVDAWTSMSDGKPDNFGRVGYDSVRLLAKGIRKAGSTETADVQNALAGSTFTTVLGDVELRASDHQALNPVWMTAIEASDSGLPNVRILEKTAGQDALPPASELGCTMN